MIPTQPIIQRLPAAVVSRIAAGEVVERPASVVKELVENALDAGASRIEVQAEQGGLWLRIADNGSGIHPQDMPLVFENHATSKLTHCTMEAVGFLEDVNTMGFRGEAVASIASVARVRCTTRTSEMPQGYTVLRDPTHLVAFDDPTTFTPAACEVGTTFEIEDLFFNIPARKAFLKQPKTELSLIEETLQQLALVSPHVQFRYMTQNALKWQTTGTGDIRDVLALFHAGRSLEAQDTFKAMLLPLHYKSPKEGLILTGWVASPSASTWHKNHKKAWQSFVNLRPVRSPEILKAIQDAYHALVPDKCYPLVCVMLTCPPGFVDVNVHPAKREVRFRTNQAVYLTVHQGVREALTAHASHHLLTGTSPMSQSSEGTEGSGGLVSGGDGYSTLKHFPEKHVSQHGTFSGHVKPFSEVPIPAFEAHHLHYEYSQPSLSEGGMGSAFPQPALPSRQNIALKAYPTTPALSSLSSATHETHTPEPVMLNTREPWRVIGQMANTYILLETSQGLMMVDQHIASERAWYERFMNQLLAGLHLSDISLIEEDAPTSGVPTQLLLVPQPLTLSLSAWDELKPFQKVLQALGFQLHYPQTPDTTEGVLLGVPNLFPEDKVHMAKPLPLFMSLFELLTTYAHTLTPDVVPSSQGLIPVVQHWASDHVATMACHRAVRAGDTLTMDMMQMIVADWLSSKLPWSCPHGRPIAHTLTMREVNQFFERPSLPANALTQR
jgi:DNA mismatch repair protein MutL